ncbi:MAG: TfoX/Sxy family protein [Chloroflexi bacterium]|nr:TfoX/Sxy family protein [Chloroflexota bacterium]MCY4246574.1 TfoX/Sxy family protein [Chloroflexota bacterium]
MREDWLRLPNIGEKSAQWLLEAGYETPAQLEADGAAMAFWRLRQSRPVSLNMLWALQGALLYIHWARLPDAMKTALLTELQLLEAARSDCAK